MRRSEKRKSEKQEDAGARKGRTVTIHCVFPMIWGSGGPKSNLAKAAGAEPPGQMRDEKVHAIVARSTFPSQSVKNPRCQTTFGSCDVEKVHAVVAQSTFPSQNAQSTPFSDHFWKLRGRRSARCCGAKHMSKSTCTKQSSFEKARAKHISKSKVSKTDGFGPLFDVQMSKKCTPLWREAHFQVKSVKS